MNHSREQANRWRGQLKVKFLGIIHIQGTDSNKVQKANVDRMETRRDIRKNKE